MRDRIGVLLVEDFDGNVEVQLFAKVDLARDSYDNLTRAPGRARVTFLDLEFLPELKVDADTKELPVVVKGRVNHRLGVGPVSLSEDDDD